MRAVRRNDEIAGLQTGARRGAALEDFTEASGGGWPPEIEAKAAKQRLRLGKLPALVRIRNAQVQVTQLPIAAAHIDVGAAIVAEHV